MHKDRLSAMAKAPLLCTGGLVWCTTCAASTLNLPALVSEHTHGDKCLQRCSMALLQRACLFSPQESNPKPSLISKLQNQLPDFPGVMEKNRKDRGGVEAGRESALNNIHVFQLCNLTTVKKDLLKKKKATSTFIKIRPALFLLILMTQRPNWELEIGNSKSNNPLKHEYHKRTTFTQVSCARILCVD